MDAIQSNYEAITMKYADHIILIAVLLIGTFVLGLFGRFVFGKRSAFSTAVSSAIGILFIYILTILLNSAGVRYEKLIAPLPFVTIGKEYMVIASFQGDYVFVCAELLSMVILAFLVNLADRWLPRGKNVFSWTFFRTLTVLIGYAMHLGVVYLFKNYLPEGIVTYAPTILLGLLLIMLLTGLLKIIIGTILSATVNPLIGALYTFFFANVIGKLVTRAILTTAILSGLVYLVNELGITVLAIGAAALTAYIPVLICLIIFWYQVNKIF